MLRFRINEPKGGGSPIVFIGISDENVSRLRGGDPILVTTGDAARLGLGENRIVIFHGETDETMTAQLEEHGLLPEGSAERVGDGMRKKRGVEIDNEEES